MSAASPTLVIVCDNASLKMGGESARPYHYFRIMRSRGVDAYLVTHERCRKELQNLLSPEDFARSYYAPDTRIHKTLWKMGAPFPHQFRISTFGALGMFLTERWQRKLIRGLVPEKKIELVHQPTPISPKQPSAIHSMGVPVVIGPLNGDINYPPAFSYMEGGLVKLSVAVSRFAGKVLNFLIPGKRRASVILVSNERTRKALPSTQAKVIQLVANAVDLKSWDAPPAKSEGEPPRFCFLGRLVDFKMVDLLLEAFKPVAKKYNAQLDIIGEGDKRAEWEALASHLGLAGHVTFHGWKKYADAAAIMAGADAMVFPSLRECGGAVVMEAMAVGLPVIAADWGGPADYVGDDNAGMLVKPDTKEGFVRDLTASITKIAADPVLARQMSQNARGRAEREFQWDSRVDALMKVYAEVLSGSLSR